MNDGHNLNMDESYGNHLNKILSLTKPYKTNQNPKLNHFALLMNQPTNGHEYSSSILVVPTSQSTRRLWTRGFRDDS